MLECIKKMYAHLCECATYISNVAHLSEIHLVSAFQSALHLTVLHQIGSINIPLI